jgi:1-acyl-sn-glycerol-3-phosphate acyltransferase
MPTSPPDQPPESLTEPAVVRWRPPVFWRFMLGVARGGVPLFCRLRVTGQVPAALREGPLILAVNHIGNFDPVIVTAACRVLGLAPRMMATGGLFRAPLLGRLMRWAGHIRVDRRTPHVGQALDVAAQALRVGSHILIYPEGRISLDPAGWPERGKTGPARMALATGTPVLPLAQWGAHEIMAYHGRLRMLASLVSAVWRRPRVRVHLGDPVDLSDLRAGEVGHAQRATDRIIGAITADLVRIRPDEPGLPRYVDPTRPVTLARAYRSRPAPAGAAHGRTGMPSPTG